MQAEVTATVHTVQLAGSGRMTSQMNSRIADCYCQYRVLSLQENIGLTHSGAITTFEPFRSNISAIAVMGAGSLSGVQNAKGHPTWLGEPFCLNLLTDGDVCAAERRGRWESYTTQDNRALKSELHGFVPDDVLHGKGGCGHRHGTSCFGSGAAILQWVESQGDLHFRRWVLFFHGWQSSNQPSGGRLRRYPSVWYKRPVVAK